VSKLKRRGERELKKVQSQYRRSTSGLKSVERRIETAKEHLTDVSGVLTQKLAQQESIQRLVAAAEERLNREKEAKEQVEQEIDFAESDEEKQNSEFRLRSISNRILELVTEIKERNKTRKKLTDYIEEYSKSTSKISSQIQKQAHNKPTLKKLIQTSQKASKRLLKTVSRKRKNKKNLQNLILRNLKLNLKN